MFSRIHIIGLQHSGTRWMEHLLRANFALMVFGGTLRYGNKHMMPSEDDNGRKLRDFLKVLVHKRFDLWLESIGRSLPGKPERPEIMDGERIDYDKALALHEQFHEEWLREPNICLVDYQKALSDTPRFLEAFGAYYGIPMMGQEWELDVKPRGFTKEQRERYLCL